MFQGFSTEMMTIQEHQAYPRAYPDTGKEDVDGNQPFFLLWVEWFHVENLLVL